MSVEFVAEIPIPQTNSVIYLEIYEHEQLLRRVAHAALMAKGGSSWFGLLPEGRWPELKKRVKRLTNRVHLGCENSGNAVWLTTLEELREILLLDSVWPIVKQFTGYQRDFLSSKLQELIEIRNVVGHNRAATPHTLTVWRGIAASLRPGLQAFQAELALYRWRDPPGK